MYYKIVPLIILISFLFLSCANNLKKEDALQTIIESTYEKHPDAIGIMVHVEAPDQSISWSQAIGFSNWDKTDSIEADQPALIASITKNFVAVSILKLVEENRLNLYQCVNKLLTKKTSALMRKHNFNLDSIKVVHLLSHKSGIPGHTGSDEFQHKVKINPMYRWTRDEQIKIAITQGPVNPPSTTFNYTDTNYLLLTEIIEKVTGLKFYEAINELVGYEKIGLTNTWFYTLESIPAGTKPLIHQYVPKNNEDSYAINNSVDLYGGGGIAATTKDLGKYAYNVFQGNVFDKKETLNLMFTDVRTSQGNSVEDYIGDIPCEYYLGIQECGFDEINSFWHSGYWGTIFRYFPTLNSSVVLYVVNEEKFADIELDLMKQITEVLK